MAQTSAIVQTHFFQICQIGPEDIQVFGLFSLATMGSAANSSVRKLPQMV